MKTQLVILGGGESGVGAALLAKEKGYQVVLMDEGSLKDGYRNELQKADVEFWEGSIDEERLLNADEVVKSPGIPEKNEWVKKLRAKNISIISEIELAYRHKGDSKIIAITGSNGKSTTTALMYHICKVAGLDCALVGNIGYSIARQVAEDPKALYVAEISSFQLDDIVTFRPDVAVLLNITEDHLDRYDYKFENYISSKFRIAMNQTTGDYFIYNMDDDIITRYMKQNQIQSIQLPMSMKQKVDQGGYIQKDELHVKVGSEEQSMSIYDFALKGKHNQYNTMVSIHRCNDGNIRAQFQKTPVIFICLDHTNIIVAAPKIRLIVHCYSAQESIASITSMRENMRCHGSNGCFAMCTTDANIKRASADPLQYITAFDDLVTVCLIVHELCMFLWNRRSIHYKCNIFRNCSYIFLIMNADPFCYQLLC